jgi:hypothetical protein
MGGHGSGRSKTALPKRHGTWQRYIRGCHCKHCKQAWAFYMRDRRDRIGRKRKVPYYARRTAVVPFRLTTLGAEILSAVQEREQRTYGDIIEHLLRLYAAELKFVEDGEAAA